MAIPITIPRLGWNMEEGVFVEWLKPDGAAVRVGEPLFTLEGEKTTEDVESLDAGTLALLPNGPRPGDRLAVGTLIGYLLAAGETAPAAADTATKPVMAAVAMPIAAAPVRDRLPRAVAASPRARRVARELGVDWRTLRGSGRGGRIREQDVRAAASNSAPPGAASDVAVPVTTMRRTIAERMLNSHRSTAPVTLTTTADATNLVNLRAQFKAAGAGGPVPGYIDFLMKLAAAALARHPLLNSRWEGEHIVTPAGIHIGFAVDTDAGLLVPVMRDVPALGLRQLATRTLDLAERARAGKLKADEIQGGTFTITNLGGFGIETFTPIINYPQCAILGLGRIERRPVVVGEQIVVREQLPLSLTFDHRLADGAPAARFLQTLRTMVENPGPWLLP